MIFGVALVRRGCVTSGLRRRQSRCTGNAGAGGSIWDTAGGCARPSHHHTITPGLQRGLQLFRKGMFSGHALTSCLQSVTAHQSVKFAESASVQKDSEGSFFPSGWLFAALVAARCRPHTVRSSLRRLAIGRHIASLLALISCVALLAAVRHSTQKRKRGLSATTKCLRATCATAWANSGARARTLLRWPTPARRQANRLGGSRSQHAPERRHAPALSLPPHPAVGPLTLLPLPSLPSLAPGRGSVMPDLQHRVDAMGHSR